MRDINLFFAVDNNYCPFLSSTLTSIFANASKKYNYNLYVLHSGVSKEYQEMIKNQVEGIANITFVDMKEKLELFSNKLVTRDYYTKTTYYRLFIPNMFPKLKKALYLDSDIIVEGDISKLYNTPLLNNLVGAVPDAVIANIEVFNEYASKVLGVRYDKYFNAGILLMNLTEMRKFKFEEKFIDLLQKYTFTVAQDQDYLNVLTKDRVRYIDYSWNTMPIENNVYTSKKINLIHYNMLWKPWIFDNTLYSETFWKYAKQCPFYENIMKIKQNHSTESRNNMLAGGEKLIKLAKEEIENPYNYNKMYNKPNENKSILNNETDLLSIMQDEFDALTAYQRKLKI